MKKAIQNLKFKRRRKAATDYKKRLGLVKSGIDRIVVRKTNKRIISQVVRYTEKGDVTIAYADSGDLKKMGWPSNSNKATAYLTGMLLASKLSEGEAKKEHILDIGLTSPVKNSIPFVFAKGCIDGGLNVKGSIDIKENVYDYSDTKYVKELKEKDREKYNKLFSGYISANVEPESLNKLFNEVKGRIKK